MSQINGIRNPNGIFINTNCFREEALHFMKYGYYCPDPWGSPAWREYWEEQLKRSIEGYSSGGVKITGDHYSYLNFGQIKLTPEFVDAQKKNKGESVITDTDKNSKRRGREKIVTFPSFWSLDYNYFHVVDIARWGISPEELEKLGLEIIISPDNLNGGYHIFIGKSRRKGFSYKNGYIAANRYNTLENSVTLLCAYDMKYLYPKGTMSMVNEYINFYNEHTGWAKARDFVNQGNHKKASYEEKDENHISVEKGYKSTVMALSFQDNPDAAIGKDGTLILYEEGGMFPNLEESYMKTKPTLEDGIYTTGQQIVFGTGGDMESGTTDFAKMFYNPEAYGAIAFKNIWDENVAENSKCGFYVPDYWCKPGYIDENGNSNNAAAKEYEVQKRKRLLEKSTSSSALNEYIQQYSFSPSESFLQSSHNEFPVEELKKQLEKIIANDLYIKKTQPVILYQQDGIAKMRPDLKGETEPIIYYPTKTKNLTGAVVILEPPVPNPPKGLYKAGYDPYRQDLGTSLGAFYVYKSANSFSYTHSQLVAWYVGRPPTSDMYNRNVELLAELYNLEVMHENEVTEVRSYFKRRNKLHLLAAQPDAVIGKVLKNSKVSRGYGMHMVDKLKDAGEKYIKKWLLEERDVDEDGKKILNLETIYDIGLLQELIQYNRKSGNFDRVMALMQIMFQLEDEEEGKVYGEKKVSEVAKKLLNLNLYKR